MTPSDSVHLSIPDNVRKKLERLKALTGLTSDVALVRLALPLLECVAEAQRNGEEVVFVKPDGTHQRLDRVF